MSVNSILTTVISVVITLLITFIFNGVVNFPKKKKKQQEEATEDRKKFKQELLLVVGKNDEKIYSELKKQSETDKAVIEDLKQCKLGLQTVIKSDLKTAYEKWIKKGYAPANIKDELERMYQVYHQLGANGVMDSFREKFLALPNSSSVKHDD